MLQGLHCEGSHKNRSMTVCVRVCVCVCVWLETRTFLQIRRKRRNGAGVTPGVNASVRILNYCLDTVVHPQAFNIIDLNALFDLLTDFMNT